MARANLATLMLIGLFAGAYAVEAGGRTLRSARAHAGKQDPVVVETDEDDNSVEVVEDGSENQPASKSAVDSIAPAVSMKADDKKDDAMVAAKEDATEEDTTEEDTKEDAKVAVKAVAEKKSAAAASVEKRDVAVAAEEDDNDELKDAQNEAKEANTKLAAFKDDDTFHKENKKLVKGVAKQSESNAFAKMLGNIRSELRQFAAPTHKAHLKAKVQKAEQRVEKLQAEQSENEEPEETGKTALTAHEADATAQKVSHKTALTTTDETVKEAERKAAETLASSMFATVILLAVVFRMSTHKNAQVQNYTWFVIDQVILIFLAVLYFQAFDSMLDFHEVGIQSQVIVSTLHAVVVLAMILIIARVLQKRSSVAMAVLCGAGAHISSFTSIHAAATHQNHLMGLSYTWTMAIFGICVVGLALAILGFLIFTAKKQTGLLDNDAYMDKADDVENDFGSMAFSVVFTMFIRFLITGHHPDDDEADVDQRHSKAERIWMFVYAIIALALAAVVTKICSKKSAQVKSYAAKRVLNFVGTVATMNVAWAFLFWGEWEFFDELFMGEELRGKVMFAISATVVCGIGLYIETKMPETDKRMTLVTLTALSLVIAWSWEGCFDAAVEAMTDESSHPVFLKVASTLGLFLIVLPVYAFNIKPITGPACEAIGA